MTSATYRLFWPILGFALVAMGCDDGTSDSTDDTSPAVPSSSFEVARAFFGGGGAIAMTSTAAAPRFAMASASLGQAGPVGVVGGISEPALLAGIWPIVQNYQLLDQPTSPSPLAAVMPDADEIPFPQRAPAFATVQEFSGPASSSIEPAPEAPPGSRAAASEAADVASSETTTPSAATPGVPFMGGISRLLLVGALLCGGWIAGRPFTRTPRR